MNKLSLTINTSAQPVHKTTLTAKQVADLKRQIDDIDPDDDKQTQYEQIRIIVSQMNGKFENEYDQMEIAMLHTTLEAILNRGKRGSKPYELINVISKVLNRVTNTQGGRRIKRHNRRKTQRRSRH